MNIWISFLCSNNDKNEIRAKCNNILLTFFAITNWQQIMFAERPQMENILCYTVYRYC